MKAKYVDFPRDWQIVLLAAVLFFLCIEACTTTKHLQQDQTKVETQVKATEEIKTNTGADTKTQTRITAETDIIEKCDTTLSVWPVTDGKKADKPVDIKVQFERTTHRNEFTDQSQEKKEQGNTTVVKKEQLNQKSDVQHMDKTVERTGLPWWAIAILVIAILIGVAVLLWRLKVF